MKKLYITFSGERYHDTTQKIVERATTMGADQLLIYDDWWLLNCRPDFVRQNEWLFKFPCRCGAPNEPTSHDEPGPRGVCWFAWKPLVVLDALDRCESGDIVLYTDADTYPIANFSVLYDICAKDGGVMLFSAVGHLNKFWCKRECLAAMGQDEPRYREVQHAVARFMLFQKSAHPTGHRPTQLLWEWFTYCLNPLCQTFTQTHRLNLPEYPEFEEHRCEQAMLTNLAHKYGFKLYREACDFGAGAPEDKELFPQLFQHHISGYSYGPVRGQGSMFRNVSD